MKNLIFITFVFSLISLFLTISGYFNYNYLIHSHILTLFKGKGDGLLGVFFLVCFIHDFIVVFLLNFIIYKFCKK